MTNDDDYMDKILLRKGFKELDDSLRFGVVKDFWERLKTAIHLEIEHWNQKCRPYDAASTRITFYPNPFVTEQMKSIAEITGNEHLKDWLDASDLGGAPMWSVCAETVGKGVTGEPKSRLYVWLTQADPHQIRYSYGARLDYNKALEIPLRVDAGAIVFEDAQDEADFLRRTVRSLLSPVMEAA